MKFGMQWWKCMTLIEWNNNKENFEDALVVCVSADIYVIRLKSFANIFGHCKYAIKIGI